MTDHRAAIIDDFFTTDLSPDGETVLLRGEESTVAWRPRQKDDSRIAVSPFYRTPDSGFARLSPDGSQVVVLTEDRNAWALETWSTQTKAEEPVFSHTWNPSDGVPFLINEQLAISVPQVGGQSDLRMQFWNPKSLIRKRLLADPAPGQIKDAVLTDTGIVAIRFHSRNMAGRLVDLATGKTVANIREGWTASGFSETGHAFVHGVGDGYIFWREATTGKVLGSFPTGTARTLRDLYFTGEWSVLSNEGDTVKVWELDLAEIQKGHTPRVSMEMEVLNDTIIASALSPNKKWFVTGHGRGEIILWSTKTWTPVAELFAHGTTIRGLQFSADNGTLLSADISGELRHWDLDPQWQPMSGSHWQTDFRYLSITREQQAGKTLIRIEGKP